MPSLLEATIVWQRRVNLKSHGGVVSARVVFIPHVSSRNPEHGEIRFEVTLNKDAMGFDNWIPATDLDTMCEPPMTGSDRPSERVRNAFILDAAITMIEKPRVSKL